MDSHSCVDGLIERRWCLQVNRSFRDAIAASPLIQHKIDLFAVGLEYNAAAGISLVDGRKALLQYRSSFDSLRPIEERIVHLKRGTASMSGGVYAVASYGGPVQLFALGSASRGIPHKQWETPLAFLEVYGLCPNADVIAFPERGTGYVRS
jgi:hypothetical protein